MKRMALSEREMALRHPRAFPLVAVTPTAEGPALAHARRTMRVVVKSGLPEHLFSDVWLVDDAFTTGFLLIETTTICRKMDSGSQPQVNDTDDELAGTMAATLTGDAFARGLDLVYEGLRATFARELSGLGAPGDSARGAGLELRRKLLHLRSGEDGPVLADVHGPDVAASALAEPALHAVPERGEDGVVGEAELLDRPRRVRSKNAPHVHLTPVTG